MLLSVAAMLGAAMVLSGVAQPISGSADAKCAKLAIKTLGASFNPSNYTFIGGTEGDNVFTGTAGPDVFCGFGRDDSAPDLKAGDIFLGGAGNDRVGNSNYGTFYGGEGTDVVGYNYPGGTFFGEGATTMSSQTKAASLCRIKQSE
jgi:hypothetical protein